MLGAGTMHIVTLARRDPNDRRMTRQMRCVGGHMPLPIQGQPATRPVSAQTWPVRATPGCGLRRWADERVLRVWTPPGWSLER